MKHFCKNTTWLYAL